MKVLFKVFLMVSVVSMVACAGSKNKTEAPPSSTDSPIQDDIEESTVEIKVIDNGGEDFPVLDLLPRESIVYYVAEESTTIYYSVSDKAEVVEDLGIEETDDGWLIEGKIYIPRTVDEMDENVLWQRSGSNSTKLTDYECTAISCIRGGTSYYDAIVSGQSLCVAKVGSTCEGKTGAIAAMRYPAAGCRGTGTRVTIPGVICN